MFAPRLAAGVILLTACAGVTRAEVSATVTATSDYDFRGITQTAQDPALQIGLDWSAANGVYAGLWASNVDFGTDKTGGPHLASDIEVDLLFGYGGSFTENFGYDLGVTYYKYLPSDDDIDYYEVHGGLNYSILSTSLWYAPDYINTGDSAWYASATVASDFGFWGLGWEAHAGYSFGDYFSDDPGGLTEYYDWSLGLTRSFGRFDCSLKYVDGSDLEEQDNTGTPPDANSSAPRAIFSIAITFPKPEA